MLDAVLDRFIDRAPMAVGTGAPGALISDTSMVTRAVGSVEVT